MFPSSKTPKQARRSSLAGVLATSVLFASASMTSIASASDSPQFDVPPIVAAREVTTAEFAQANPGQRLWEVKLAVSVLARPAEDAKLAQLLVRIDSPRRSLRVVDFAPRTTLASDVQGTIRRERHAESNRSFEFHVRAGLPGIGDGAAQGSSNAHETIDEQSERLPPLTLCIASGTTNRGSGAYFKLKPTPRTTLEGAHEFTLWVASPDAWTGDHLRARCEMYAKEPMLVSNASSTVAAGGQDFVVAVHRMGDVDGLRAAERLMRAENDLRRAVALNRRELAKSREGDLVREFAALWNGRDPRLPNGWFEQLVYGPPLTSSTTLDLLPEPVRQAAQRYATAKHELITTRRATTNQIVRLPPLDHVE